MVPPERAQGQVIGARLRMDGGIPLADYDVMREVEARLAWQARSPDSPER